MKKLMSFAFPMLLLTVCCTRQEPPAEAAGEALSEEINQDPQAILEHHVNAFGENDLDAVMEDYTDGSVVITPDSTYRGLEQIRGFFEAVIPSFPTEGSVLELVNTTVEGNLVYIFWHGTTPTLDIPMGTDTFIMEDGKISIQTFAAMMNPVEDPS